MHAAEDVKIYLIGNKCEEGEKREVTKDRAIAFAKERKIHKVFETSAKTGDNVEDVFSCAAREIFLHNEKGENSDDDETTETGTTEKKPRASSLNNQNGKINIGKKIKDEGKQKKKGCC